MFKSDRFRQLVTPAKGFIEPVAGQRIRLSGLRTEIPLPDSPIEIELGKEQLHIQKDIGLYPTKENASTDLIVFNPKRYFSGIGYALRLKQGEHLQISHKYPDQAHLFEIPREAFRRHFQVEHLGDRLVFRDPISELGTYFTILDHSVRESILLKRRRQALDGLLALFGRNLSIREPYEALQNIRRINQLLRREAYRRPDPSGNAGGALELPAEPTPVIVGDLHANLDNLFRVLTEGALLQGLEEKSAILLLLGDVTHRDLAPYDYMDSSVLMMDLLFELKLHFPEGVFLLRGNHESFSPELSKCGIPQALLWERRLTELRGKEYCVEMSKFYEQSPVLAYSSDFVACHAGPARSKTSITDIDDIRHHPTTAHELTWNRIRRPASPNGYTAGDVRRFRKSLGIAPHTPFLVGHYPYANDGTLWQDVGGIQNHHIVYSAKPEQLGLFTRFDDRMVPLTLPAEPLMTMAVEGSAVPAGA